MAFGSEARPSAATAPNFYAAERDDDLLAHRRALATAFDDLEVGAAPEVFLRKCMARTVSETHARVHAIRHEANTVDTKSTIKRHYIFAKFTACFNNINRLRTNSRAQVCKGRLVSCYRPCNLTSSPNGLSPAL
jgi:hypothetical protein